MENITIGRSNPGTGRYHSAVELNDRGEEYFRYAVSSQGSNPELDEMGIRSESFAALYGSYLILTKSISCVDVLLDVKPVLPFTPMAKIAFLFMIEKFRKMMQYLSNQALVHAMLIDILEKFECHFESQDFDIKKAAEIELVIRKELHQMLVELRDEDSKGVHESVITGSANIVPYMGKLVKPGMETDTAESTSEKNSPPSTAGADIYTRIGSWMNDLSSPFNHLCEILLERGNAVMEIQMHIPSSRIFLDFALTYPLSCEYHKDVYEFYVMAYYYYIVCADKTENRIFRQFIDGTLINEPMDALLEAASAFITDAAPSIDPIKAMAKEMDDRLYDSMELVDSDMFDLSFYNITSLRDYLATTRRYKGSKYISSLFLSQNKTIDHFVAKYNDIPIAEVADKYIVAPVVDTANSYKPVLVILDRHGKIFTMNTLLVTDLNF